MSATNYDGRGDADHVAKRLADVTTPEMPSADEAIAASEHADVRDHVETAETPETVEITVDGETVECEPPSGGAGEKYRPLTDLVRGEERGDGQRTVFAIMDMIDTLVAASDDDHQQAFWDRLDEETITNAYSEFLRAGAGGNGRAK